MPFFSPQQPAQDPMNPIQDAAMAAQNPSGGILGYLRDPYIRAALAGASQGFAKAAGQGIGGAGYALSQGLSDASQGAMSWEEQQAKAAAERVNQMAADRRGTTDYRYRLNLVAQRIAKEKNIPLADAEIEAEQIMASQGVENQGQIVTLRGEEARKTAEYVKELERRLEEFKIGKAPEVAAEVAAATEQAKAGVEKAVDVSQKVEKAQNAIDELNNMKSALAVLPSPFGQKLESFKAQFGAGDPKLQEAMGRVKRISGRMLEYVNRLPGAATDADREIFMASAGVINDINTPPEQKIAAANDAIASYERLIAKYGKPAAPSAPAGGKPKLKYNPQTGKVE